MLEFFVFWRICSIEHDVNYFRIKVYKFPIPFGFFNQFCCTFFPVFFFQWLKLHTLTCKSELNVQKWLLSSHTIKFLFSNMTKKLEKVMFWLLLYLFLLKIWRLRPYLSFPILALTVLENLFSICTKSRETYST